MIKSDNKTIIVLILLIALFFGSQVKRNIFNLNVLRLTIGSTNPSQLASLKLLDDSRLDQEILWHLLFDDPEIESVDILLPESGFDFRGNVGICGAANVLFMKNNNELAVELLQKTGNYLCLESYADRLLADGNGNDALNLYNEIMIYNPKKVEIHRKVLGIYQTQNQNDQVKEEYYLIISLEPTSSDYVDFLRFLRRNQQYQDAIQVAKEAIEEYDDSSWIIYEVANLYVDVGRPQDAQNLVESAIKDRSIARNFFTKCVILFRLNQPEEAIDACEKSISLEPEFFDAYKKLIEFNFKEGNIQQAVGFAEDYLSLVENFDDGNEYLANILLGGLFYRLGDDETAEFHFCEAKKIDEKRYNLGNEINWLKDIQYFCDRE